MKVQSLLICVMCAIVHGQNYFYPKEDEYVPIIKDGVPVDTPEVQAAKAAHFQAYAKAQALAAKNPSNGQYEEYEPYQNNVIYDGGRQDKYTVAAYSSDIPYDTPEVQRAKIDHYSALSRVQSRPHYRLRRSLYQYQQDAPEDTLEVKAAKYEHALAQASAYEKDVDDEYPSYPQEYYHFPIITRKGIPVNTPEVKLARHQHTLAQRLAKSGVTYSGGFSEHIPVISPNGVPFDTPDVYLAKVQHLAIHAKEALKNNKWDLSEGLGGHY